MGERSSSSSSGGIGFFGLLQVIFIILKLVEFQGNPVTEWSWWVVLIPTWIALGLFVLAAALLIVVALVKSNKDRAGRYKA